MAYFERSREAITGPLSLEAIRERMAAGWQMVSIEWQRELAETETSQEGALAEETPYGLRIAADSKQLEMEPAEHEALLLMMELLAQNCSYSGIVNRLNEKGFRTREGNPWTRVAVFNMMPRLIEAGPRIFASDAWEQRRKTHPDCTSSERL